MSLARRCQHEFDDLTRLRGQAYADKGAVILLGQRGDSVYADVTGSNFEPYSVSINWRRSFAELFRRSFTEGFPDPWAGFERASRRAWYVLDVRANTSGQDLLINLMQQERKKNGEYGKFKTLTFSWEMVDEFDDPADREMLMQLADCSQVRSEYDPYRYRYANDSLIRRLTAEDLKLILS